MRRLPVQWSEGMLLLPHHFQAGSEHAADALATATNWIQPYAYGVHAIEVTSEALANFEVRIPRIEARLRDGSMIVVPDNASLPALNIAKTMEESAEVFIHLTLPPLSPGRVNASREAGGQESRFVVHDQEWIDLNQGASPRVIETHRYNARLVATKSVDPPKGLESIPLMKLQRGGAGKAAPVIATDYFPPLLACDVWQTLKEEIIAAITAKLGFHLRERGEFLRTRGGFDEANQPAIRKAILKYAAVSPAHAYLSQLLAARGLHPFLVYSELCRLVGALTPFSGEWKAPELDPYDHDDLGRIFWAIRSRIDRLLEEVEGERKITPLVFVGVAQGWMEVSLDPRWLRGQHEFFVGVRSSIPAEQLEGVFGRQFLNWKLGGARTIDRIAKAGEPGLRLQRVVGVHSVLPVLRDVTYFTVEDGGIYWNEVIESRTLALRFNENYIQGDFVGQQVLKIGVRKEDARDFTFTLYVVEK